MPEGTSIRPLGLSSEQLLAVAGYMIVWCSLLYSAFTLILREAGPITYLYFAALATTLGLLASLSMKRPASLTDFLGLSMVTVVLFVEEAMLNGLYPDAGLALAFTAALGLPLAGSIPKPRKQMRHALQVTGLIFASRLAFIPFPQRFLTVSIAPPSIYSLIISIILAFIIVKQISLTRVGLTRGPYPLRKQIAVGASIGIFSGLIEYWILKPAPIRLTGGSLQAILYVIIVMTIFVGFGEELLFRGLVQESYQNVLPAWPAILMASIQFSLMHYGWLNPLELLFAYGMGIIFGYSFWKTKSLIAPITTHALGNIAMFIVAAYPDLMLTPIMMKLMVILAIALLLPALPWRGLLEPKERALSLPSTLKKERWGKAKKYFDEIHIITNRLLQTMRKSTPPTSPTQPEETQIPSDQYPPTPPTIVVCAYCGRVLTEGQRFCDMCGQQLLQ